MKNCLKCTNPIPTWVEVDDKQINTQRRKFCFDCSPYKSHNTRNLLIPKSTKKRGGAEAVSKWRRNLKRRMIASMGGECQCCQYNICEAAFDFHHLDPSDKEMGFAANGMCRSWMAIVKELRKCILVCCRCHREIHNKKREIPANAKGFDERWIDYRTMEGLAAHPRLERGKLD